MYEVELVCCLTVSVFYTSTRAGAGPHELRSTLSQLSSSGGSGGQDRNGGVSSSGTRFYLLLPHRITCRPFSASGPTVGAFFFPQRIGQLEIKEAADLWLFFPMSDS